MGLRDSWAGNERIWWECVTVELVFVDSFSWKHPDVFRYFLGSLYVACSDSWPNKLSAIHVYLSRMAYKTFKTKQTETLLLLNICTLSLFIHFYVNTHCGSWLSEYFSNIFHQPKADDSHLSANQHKIQTQADRFVLNFRLAVYCIKQRYMAIKLPNTGLASPFGYQEVEALRIWAQPGHVGGKFVSPHHRAALLPRR
jgi:hypothetical protein